MAKGNIILHKKYGLNPKMILCLICNKETNAIALAGAKVDNDDRFIKTGELCDACKELLKQGNTAFFNKENGDSAILTGEAVKRMFPDKPDWIGKVVMTDHTFWKQGDIDNG